MNRFKTFFVVLALVLLTGAAAHAGETEDLLAATDIFQGLSQAQLSQVASVSFTRFGASGETLIPQGEVLDTLYTLSSGHAVVNVEGVGQVFEFGPGVVVGEGSFVSGGPASADVVLDQDSDVIEIDGVALRELMEADCCLGYAIMKNMAFKLTTY